VKKYSPGISAGVTFIKSYNRDSLKVTTEKSYDRVL